jgi:uncharacterized membrane protein YeiB
MRTRAVLWRIALLAAWFGALLGLAALDGDELLWYAVVGAPLTVLVGAVIDRWWAVLVPGVVSAVWIGIALATEPTCSDCNGEDLWGLAILIVGIVFTAPATAALAIGVTARRLTRFFRDLDSGPDPEPT